MNRRDRTSADDKTRGNRRLEERTISSLMDALSTHIAILSRDGTIVKVNRAWRRFADANGYRGEAYGVGDNYLRVCEQAAGEDAESAMAAARGIREVFAGHRDEFYLEYPCHGPDVKRWFQLRATRLEGVGPGYVVTAHENITEVKRAGEEVQFLNMDLERRVMQRTSQLEASTGELENFCYAVSHDLRAPLARLEGFSRGLFEDCAGQLDSQGKFYVERICRISIDLRRLIDTLLDLSRLTRREISKKQVSLSGIARMVIEELRREQPLRRVDVVIAPEVEANGDPDLLMVVLENLLGNAWKYTEKRQDAMIEFGVTRKYGQAVYFVRDNGAGFDMKYSGKLFGPFQRLHSPVEFTGIGLGLATSRRIIQRHGGRIWAEGETEKGAVFYFTL